MFSGYTAATKRTVVAVTVIVVLIVSYWLWHTTPKSETHTKATVTSKESNVIELLRQPVFMTYTVHVMTEVEDDEREVYVGKAVYDGLSEGDIISAVIYIRYDGSSKLKIISGDENALDRYTTTETTNENEAGE